jgi:hypothetical protein
MTGLPATQSLLLRSTLDAVGTFVATMPPEDRPARQAQVVTFLKARPESTTPAH